MFLVDLTLSHSREIAQLKQIIANIGKVGTVCDTDPVKGYRLSYGDDGKGGEYKSPWKPHPESGGATGTWFPLSKGQVVCEVNPTGDPRQGFLLRGGFSGQNPAPSQNLDENVYTFGDARITVRKNEMEITRGGQTVVLRQSGETYIGGGSKIVLDAPVEMPKGFTAGEGKGTVGVMKGALHVEQEVKSNKEVSAPVLRGTVVKP